MLQSDIMPGFGFEVDMGQTSDRLPQLKTDYGIDAKWFIENRIDIPVIITPHSKEGYVFIFCLFNILHKSALKRFFWYIAIGPVAAVIDSDELVCDRMV